MLIPFRKLFNQATKAGSSDYLILLPGTKLNLKVGSKLFLEAGSANRYDAKFPARFSFAPIALIAAVRWAVFGPSSLLALSAFALEAGTALEAKHPFFHMWVISVRNFSLSLMPNRCLIPPSPLRVELLIFLLTYPVVPKGTRSLLCC